jgi:hypothetical protein
LIPGARPVYAFSILWVKWRKAKFGKPEGSLPCSSGFSEKRNCCLGWDSVFNLKLCAIVAIAAFFLSFLLGLVTHATMPTLILRPVIFAVIFFGVSAFINILVTHFLPELLEENMPEHDHDHDLLPGSRINIVEGDPGALDYSQGIQAAVPGQGFMGAQPDDNTDDVGDISVLANQVSSFRAEDSEIPKGMDHNENSGYNEGTGMVNFSEKVTTVAQNVEPKRGEAFDDSEESLPDLDSMAGAFVSSSSQEDPDTTEYSVSAPVKKPSSRTNKGGEWAGDFNAKDIAAGLRTVLKRDKEG